MPDFDTTPVASQVGIGAPGYQQSNPLQMVGQIADTRQKLNQLQLFPQQQALLAAQVGTAQQDLQAKRIAALQGALASTQDDSEVPSIVARFTQAGLIDADTAANVLGGNVASLSPAAIKAARQQAIMMAGNAAELRANVGEPSTIQTGGGTETLNTKVGFGGTEVSPATGSGAFVPNALGPKDLSTPVETTDPDTGEKHMGVMGDYISPNGAWKDGTPHPLTALGPLSASTQATLGAAYGPQIAAFENSAPQIAAGRQAVENLRAEGDQFAAGPQSDFWKHLGELASEYGVSLTPPADASETAAREAYAKNLTLVLSAQQKALHMDATDASRQTAELSVPSEMTTPEGRNRALAVIEGNLDAQNAMLSMWEKQKAKYGPATWGQFQVEFPNKVPPSIFQAQYMSPAEIATMQKGWSAAQKATWQKRFDAAKNLGWLPNAQ